MLNLEIGNKYSFNELKEAYGHDRSYSFQKNGAVTAFIVNGKMNPSFQKKAGQKTEILVAKGSMREGIVTKVKNSSYPFPTFIKMNTNEWIFAGEYCFEYYLDRKNHPEEVKIYEEKAEVKLDEIVGVIVLKRVEAKKAILKRNKAA